MGFYVGQEVVCVDASLSHAYLPDGYYRACIDDLDGLIKGKKYTVRHSGVYFGVHVVRLEEIVRPLNPDGEEAPYSAARFRPVVSRKTDISVFTALLHTTKHKEPV